MEHDKTNRTIQQDNKFLAEIQTLEQIKDLAVDDRMMFSVRDLDLTIAEQMGDKGRTISCKTLYGRAPLCLAGDKLFYSSRDGLSLIANFNNKNKQFKEITEIKACHEKLVNALIAKEVNGKTFLYSAGWDCIVKQWSITEEGHKAGASCTLPVFINVLCMDNDGKSIYAAGGDGNIWRLDYSE